MIWGHFWHVEFFEAARAIEGISSQSDLVKLNVSKFLLSAFKVHFRKRL